MYRRRYDELKYKINHNFLSVDYILITNKLLFLMLLSGPVSLTTPLQWSKTHHPNECPGYDTKQSDGEASVTLELKGMQSTHCSQVNSGLER